MCAASQRVLRYFWASCDSKRHKRMLPWAPTLRRALPFCMSLLKVFLR